MDHGDHGPRLVGHVRHPGVPQPQVADDDAPGPDGRLERRADGAAGFHGLRGQLDVALLDVDRRVQVRAGPDFRAAVLRRHVHDGDIDDQAERGRGDGQVRPQLADVGVDRLALAAAADGGVAAVKAVVQAVARAGRA